jgi:gamma-glutamyltranspeptidase/glutathione hydrolase
MTAPFEWSFPYASRRAPVLARHVVATSHPLATSAGLAMMQQGGNAVDAALAAAITLTIVEPTSNGIGSDAFAIIHDGGRLYGLNASGRSPAAWTPARFAGRTAMPLHGWDSVTVPGAVSAWETLSRRFGRLPFARLFEPAIHHARTGFAVSPITGAAWEKGLESRREFAEFRRVFAPGGRAPRIGEVVHLPDHAATLEAIATGGADVFYRGRLAEAIAAAAARDGAALTLADLDAHKPDWVEPLAVDYAGVRLHEIPPNGQGIAALIALGLLGHTPYHELDPDSPAAMHLLVEAVKLALADAHAHVADPAAMAVPPAALLDPAYLADRARHIDPRRAMPPIHGTPARGGTVCLCAADADGLMVSYIQSNFWGFGSGIVVPGTGIALQNRGYGFSLAPGHPNEVGPRKRPFHTIIPGFVTTPAGGPLMAFGLMGGAMQAQGHAQVVARLAAHRQNPQAASDAPRWQVLEGMALAVEDTMPAATANALAALGHAVERRDFTHFGGAQMAWRLDNGVYTAASDHRKDGHAAGF